MMVLSYVAPGPGATFAPVKIVGATASMKYSLGVVVFLLTAILVLLFALVVRGGGE